MNTQSTNGTPSLSEQAFTLYNNGQLFEAIIIFKQLLITQPNDAQLLMNLGTLSLQVGNIQESQEFNHQAIRIDPGQVIAHVHLGIGLQHDNQHTEAIASYNQAILIDPSYSGAFYNRGNALHDLQHYPEAIGSYDQAIALNPEYTQAYSNRGIALRDLHRYEEAINSYDQAIALNPHYAEAYANKGVALHDLHRNEAAIDSYDQAILINPNYADAYSNRGISLHDLLRTEAAIDSYDQALKINPQHASANFNRGNALQVLEQYDKAIISYDNAIAINPNYAEAYSNRGISLHNLKRFDEALDSYDHAISINNTYTSAHYNRGATFYQLRNLDAAISCYDTVIAMSPHYPDAAFNRGNALNDLSRFSEAVESYNQAIDTNPESAKAYFNRGNVLNKLHHVNAALASYDSAILIDPHYAEAYSNRGSTLSDLKRFDEAITSFDQALLLMPDIDYLYGTRLHAKMHICDWADLSAQIKQLTQAIKSQQKISTPFSVLALIDDPTLQQQAAAIFIKDQQPIVPLPRVLKYHRPQPVIRVAYYSADYHDHATMHLIAELFEQHNTQQFELTAFSFGAPSEDIWRKRVKTAFGNFINVQHHSDEDIVALSKLLKIDIAVDLKGYTTDARPQIFSQRAAPIQVNYLGYPGTLSSHHMDYLIADRTLITQDTQAFYSENLVYLPNSYQANNRKMNVSLKPITREAMGLPSTGIVFCSFNNTFKITPQCFDSWMRILQRVKTSVLWLYVSNPSAITNLQREAEQRGVAKTRLLFAHHLPSDEHLARLPLADLFLDTLPYNAHTTASDALRMGLPLLTCQGTAFASRVSSSLLKAVNLPELIANNLSDYENIAVDLATDPNKLKLLKNKLIKNVATAQLFNSPLFSKHLETAYQAMYAQYCSGNALHSIEITDETQR